MKIGDLEVKDITALMELAKLGARVFGAWREARGNAKATVTAAEVRAMPVPSARMLLGVADEA